MLYLPFRNESSALRRLFTFGLRHSFVIRHSSFVIDQQFLRHSPFEVRHWHLSEHICDAARVINNVVRLEER